MVLEWPKVTRLWTATPSPPDPARASPGPGPARGRGRHIYEGRPRGPPASLGAAAITVSLSRPGRAPVILPGSQSHPSSSSQVYRKAQPCQAHLTALGDQLPARRLLATSPPSPCPIPIFLCRALASCSPPLPPASRGHGRRPGPSTAPPVHQQQQQHHHHHHHHPARGPPPVEQPSPAHPLCG